MGTDADCSNNSMKGAWKTSLYLKSDGHGKPLAVLFPGMKQQRKGLHTLPPRHAASAAAALPELRRSTDWAFEGLVGGRTFPS